MTSKQPPEVLYHYCSLETLSKIIGDITRRVSSRVVASRPNMVSKIQLSSYHHLNDPGESLTVSSLYDPSSREKYFHPILKNTKTFVSCFTEDGDNLTMWRAYAGDGRGVCIGFNTACLQAVIKRVQEDEKYDENLKIVLNQVKYIKNNDDNGVLKDGVGAHIFRDLEEGKFFNIDQPFLTQATECWSIKSADYEVEKEWKLIVSLTNAYFKDKFLVDIRKQKCKELDLGNFDLQYRFHGNTMTERLFLRLTKQCIKEVIVGPKCSALINELERYLKMHFNESVKVRKSQTKYR